MTTTLAIDYWLGGSLNPFYFHLSTFIWFIVLGVLMFYTYKNLLQKSISKELTPYIAILATSWYLLHTANAETINYVISRSDVQSTFLIVASFLIYIAYPQKRKYYLYILPAIIGVFAKETVLVLVILLFFYLLIFEEDLSIADLFTIKKLKTIGNTILKLLPITIVIVAVQFYTLSAVKSIPGISNPLLEYLLTQTYVWLRYFITFFIPLNLSADSDWTVISNFSDPRIIIGILFLIAYVITIFKTSKNKETKPIAFGLIWFGAALLPTSLAPFAEVTNDHRMFFPFIGLSLSVVTFFGLIYQKYQNNIKGSMLSRIGISTLIILVLGLNAYGVYQRNKVWKTEATLWLDVTQKSPLNGRGFMNYGLTEMAIGNYQNAINYFNKASELLPYYSSNYVNLGIATNGLGKTSEAEPYFKKAIELAPNSYRPYQFYGRYLKDNNRYDEAIATLEKALSINSTSADIFEMLFELYNQKQDWIKLNSVCNQYLNILPNNELAKNYLIASETKTPYYPNQTVAQEPNADFYINQSLANYNQGDYQACIENCFKALELEPNRIEALINIGAANNALKKWEVAIRYLKMAEKIDPKNKLVIGNLNWAKDELAKQKK